MPRLLRVLSYNIRYHNPGDGVNAWPQRRTHVTELLQRHQPDLIGLQEVLHDQLVAIATALPEYSWVGVGRDDGKQAGEFAPIFYHRERIALQANGHFWLSEHPQQAGSMGWDAACTRVATWAVFQDVNTGTSLLHLNTHFDHRGMTAQQQSVKLLHTFLADRAGNLPGLITGDFNCTPDSATYRALTTASTAETPLRDLMALSATGHEGPIATFTTNFADPLQAKIDYIFLYRPAAATTDISIHRHAILTDQEQGRYPSDHLPVLAEVEL